MWNIVFQHPFSFWLLYVFSDHLITKNMTKIIYTANMTLLLMSVITWLGVVILHMFQKTKNGVLESCCL